VSSDGSGHMLVQCLPVVHDAFCFAEPDSVTHAIQCNELSKVIRDGAQGRHFSGMPGRLVSRPKRFSQR
jgi:hypothetical protein